jgi:hypothetical protein
MSMSDPTSLAVSAQIATLQAQISWADASILQLVQALELVNRSVHEFEATHPATISEQVQLLLQQIRQSRPGPSSAPQSDVTPPAKRRRDRRRPAGASGS